MLSLREILQHIIAIRKEGCTAVPSDGNTTSICVLLNFDAPENLCMLYGGMVAFVYLCIGVHNRCFKED